MFIQLLKQNWFLLGLISISIITVADQRELLVDIGRWLKAHHGPDLVIVVIFFLSGLALDANQIRNGIKDYKATLLALFLIFIVAPAVVLIFSLLPLDTGLMLGIFLVAVMPSTLSSGVVMTGASGGNMAHALLVTILANSLAVITIPLVLGWLLSFAGESRVIVIERLPIMIKIATLVLLPLICGILLRSRSGERLKPVLPYVSMINQSFILMIVWMALCGGRDAIVAGMGNLIHVLAMVFSYHLMLILCGLLGTKLARIPKNRRESVVMMGGQKTLPLSVILQVSLFPEYGLALVVCVSHHIVHLIMDAFLIKHLQKLK